MESGKALSREERKTERCPLLYQWHRKQYVGAAHGMAGIYYMLMQVSEAPGDAGTTAAASQNSRSAGSMQPKGGPRPCRLK